MLSDGRMGSPLRPTALAQAEYEKFMLLSLHHTHAYTAIGSIRVTQVLRVNRLKVNGRVLLETAVSEILRSLVTESQRCPLL
jgi:hypothetical protein